MSSTVTIEDLCFLEECIERAREFTRDQWQTWWFRQGTYACLHVIQALFPEKAEETAWELLYQEDMGHPPVIYELLRQRYA